MPMIMWDFDEEVTERGIEYSIEGDKMLDPDLAIEQW